MVLVSFRLCFCCLLFTAVIVCFLRRTQKGRTKVFLVLLFFAFCCLFVRCGEFCLF
jgi:hypothetical protein